MRQGKRKTGREAVDRIVWDERLDAGAFVVGWSDRRAEAGVRETALLQWQNGDIPAHRIRYIRCAAVVVWRRGEEPDRLGDADLPPEAWAGASAGVEGIRQERPADEPDH